VIELECGITVYPAREEKGRWRAVWHEDGQRQQCEASSEEKLAAKLDKVTVRLAADAPNMKRPGADLIRYYLDPDQLPVDERWSRKHGHTQRRLCERFAARSSTPSPARTSRPATCRRSSTPHPRQGKAPLHWQAGDRELPAHLGRRRSSVAAVGDHVGSPVGACCLNPAGLDAMVTLSPGGHLTMSAAPQCEEGDRRDAAGRADCGAAHEREIRG
jgi:hypothetical protein